MRQLKKINKFEPSCRSEWGFLFTRLSSCIWHLTCTIKLWLNKTCDTELSPRQLLNCWATKRDSPQFDTENAADSILATETNRGAADKIIWHRRHSTVYSCYYCSRCSLIPQRWTFGRSGAGGWGAPMTMSQTESPVLSFNKLRMKVCLNQVGSSCAPFQLITSCHWIFFKKPTVETDFTAQLHPHTPTHTHNGYNFSFKVLN